MQRIKCISSANAIIPMQGIERKGGEGPPRAFLWSREADKEGGGGQFELKVQIQISSRKSTKSIKKIPISTITGQ